MHATPSPDVVTTLSSLQVEAPKHQTRLKVALLSLPARTQAVLEFFFNSTGRSSFVPTPEEQSEAAIFDIDTVESRQHWQLYQERTGQPGIALSVQPQQLPGTVWVQKPVTPAALLSAAAEIQHQRLQKALAPPAVAAPATVTTAALDAELPHPALASHPAEAARAHLEQALSALPEAAAAASESAALPAAPTPPSPIGTALAEEPTAVSTVGFAPTAPGSLDGLPPAERPLPAASQDRTPVAAPPKPTRVETHTAAAAAAAAALSPQDTRREPTKAKAKGLGGLLRRWFGTDEPASAPASAPVAAPGSPARTPSVSPKPSTPSSDPARSAHAMASESANAGPTSTAAAAQTPVKTAPDTALPIDTVHPAVTASVDTVLQPLTAPPQPASQAPTAETAEHPTATLASAPSDRAQPVTGGVSLGGLSAAAQANDARLCGRMEDRTAQALAEDPEWRFDPEVHLVSVLREAYLVGSKWQGPTHLECSAGRVVVDATRNLLLCDFDIRLLESVITTPLGKRPKTRNLSRQEQAELQHNPPAGAGVQRLDETLWLAGLLTAGGRLPIDTDPNRPVYLRHWPNLTRLSAIPHAVRIAALWSLRGASIVETASTLGIPQRHVIAFYNGALALDLITEDGSHIRRAQRKTGRNRGLLTKLLGWLNR